MSYEFRNRVHEDDWKNVGSKHVFDLQHSIGGDTYTHDFLTEVTVLSGAQAPDTYPDNALQGDVGLSTLTVDDASSFVVGTRYWIWDIVDFKFESFVCMSFSTGGASETVATTPTTQISGSYADDSIISSTPPLHDAFLMDYWSVDPGASRSRVGVVMGNTDPSGLVYDHLTSPDVASYTANFKVLLKGGNVAGQESIIDSRGIPVTDSVGNTTKASRYLGIVRDTNSTSSDFGCLTLYRKLLTPSLLTTLLSA